MSEKATTNGNSITSLTLGILSILIPIIGLFLGVVGVVVSRKATKQIVKTNEDGRGIAMSGLICSVVGILMQLFMVMGYIIYRFFTTAG
ncbi:DUF4190 domain-containing protein [Virgibacillus litoralis]|uniref:Type IV secretory pathway TrbD component n=1 Tax=Virgibacillus litoralis TaxID=578221 RepID=A0ABS4HIN3_9BACI|nr:DUF4190 domain-containing protein [Virgibacillus litoralis]MBP1950786.1 type IV secretory pathway TrbD component [Virgibacillus litoralis]